MERNGRVKKPETMMSRTDIRNLHHMRLEKAAPHAADSLNHISW